MSPRRKFLLPVLAKNGLVREDVSEIVRRSGKSRSTVEKVLAGTPGVSRKTEVAVLRACLGDIDLALVPPADDDGGDHG